MNQNISPVAGQDLHGLKNSWPSSPDNRHPRRLLHRDGDLPRARFRALMARRTEKLRSSSEARPRSGPAGTDADGGLKPGFE